MKVCVSCGEEKPLDSYYRDSRYLDNPPRPACKICINKRQKTPKKTRPPRPKACSQCGKVKPPAEFVREPRHSDGLRAECKSCYFTRERYERDLEWRKENPERVRQYNRQSRPARDAYTVRWKREHPELVRMQDARKRAKRRSNSGVRDLTRAGWDALKAAYHFCCAYCGEPKQRLTMDHVIPLVKGGAHTANNVVPACGRCNSSKKDRQPPEYRPALVFAHLS